MSSILTGGTFFFLICEHTRRRPWSKLRPGEVSRRSVQCGGVGALAKRRHAMLAKNFCNNIYLIQFIFVWLVGIDVFFPLK